MVGGNHDFDGIKEYDNPSPKWLMYIFYVSIVFAFWYAGYYFGKANAIEVYGGEKGPHAWSHYVLDKDVADFEAKQSKSGKAVLTGDALEKYLKSNAAITKGKKVFKGSCVTCHGAKGQGGAGPNLIDKYWLHGGSTEDIIKTISFGKPDLGMPPWKNVLGVKKIQDVVAYIRSMEGVKAEGAKEAQGKLYAR